MNRYSVRPATLQDLGTVYEIIANQRIADFGTATISLDDLRKRWEKTDLDNDTLTAFADGKMAGFAELRDNDTPMIYLENRSNVDLAFQFLMLLEQKAVSRAKEKLELFAQISEKNQTLLQLFASNGYHSNLSFLTMETRLDEAPPNPEWPEGIHVRTFVRGKDEQVTYETDEEAGKDKGYHNPLSYDGWAKRMGLDQEKFDAGIWFLACEGEKVAGVVLNALDSNPNTVWVDHLSVLRGYRNKGIGKALLLHSFGEFHKRGLQVVKLNVDSKSLTNAPKLYESVGMKTTQQYHIYKKEIQV
jgi:mycothiol synthase